MKKREYRFLPARELRVQKTDSGQVLSGYAAVFNSPSEDLGGFIEQIKPGAFARCLRSNPDVSCLHEHDPRQGLLGRTKSGTLRLVEDETGLRFDCDLPNTTLANDVAESINRGDLDGCSFGFVTLDDDWATSSDGATIVRTLNDVDVFDVTVTSMPAYPATSLQLRSRLFPDGAVERPAIEPSVDATADQLLAQILERRARLS